MITIKLMSQCRVGCSYTEMHWNHPVLTVDNVPYDLSELDDGDIATDHEVLRVAERAGDDYVVKLIFPYLYPSPEITKFPQDIIMSSNGAVPLPPHGGV